MPAIIAYKNPEDLRIGEKFELDAKTYAVVGIEMSVSQSDPSYIPVRKTNINGTFSPYEHNNTIIPYPPRPVRILR